MLLLIIARPSRAYVRATSDHTNHPLSWLESCLYVTPDSRAGQSVSLNDFEGALGRAVGNWTRRTTSCTSLRLANLPADGPADVKQDGRPVVVIRDTLWQSVSGAPYDPSVIGLTTVFHVDAPGKPGDGTILDADIELNDVNYTITTDVDNAVPRANTSVVNLENTLTHELGHVQGLAHTCWDHLKPTPPLDNLGQPIPDCDSPLPASILATTMYPYPTMPKEISKRDLSDDDVQGVCDVYPLSAPRDPCLALVHDGYGCAFASGRALPAGWGSIALLLWFMRMRSRRAQRAA